MLFIQNKYTNWYYSIIQNEATENYEVHHIIPKSMGGSNSDDNLARLSSRQHYICHKLLTKMTTGLDKRKMCYALWLLTSTGDIGKTSHKYKIAREGVVKQLTSRVTCEVCGKEVAPHTYKRYHGTKCGKVSTQIPKPLRHCNKCDTDVDAANYAQYHGEKCGMPQTRPKFECEYCHKEVSKTNYTRWHGPNCKSR